MCSWISRGFGRVAEGDSRDTGAQVRNTVDCLIAAVAIRSGSPLLHCDADFATLIRHMDLVAHPASLS